jgi:hypothetical protein
MKIPNAASSDQPFVDQISLNEIDARVYEAIATLEFIGYQVKPADIATSAGLDERTVRRALSSLTSRGVLVTKGRGTDPGYEPAYRGWSAAPDHTVNPKALSRINRRDGGSRLSSSRRQQWPPERHDKADTEPGRAAARPRDQNR